MTTEFTWHARLVSPVTEHFETQTVTHKDYTKQNPYIDAGRGEVNVRVVGIIYPASLSIWIVGSGQPLEVAIGPGIDAESKQSNGDYQEEDETAYVGALAFLNCIRRILLGMGPYLTYLLMI